MGYTYASSASTAATDLPPPPSIADTFMEIRMDYSLYRGEPVWRDVYVSALCPDAERITEHARQLRDRLDPTQLLAFVERFGWTPVTGRDEAFRDTYCRIFLLKR